jgi:hypothetical protein
VASARKAAESLLIPRLHDGDEPLHRCESSIASPRTLHGIAAKDAWHICDRDRMFRSVSHDRIVHRSVI